MIIAVYGARGRVGSKVAELAVKRGHTVIPIDKKDETDNSVGNTDRIDVVIDFSTVEATSEVCELCRAHHCPLISGVTGRNDEQQRLVDELSMELPVVTKANFSVGVDMLHRICEIVARELSNWDCEIVETHRRGKLDSPSGTAKSLAASITKQKSFRHVTMHSLRCGSNYGRHEVIFATNGESLTITHQAESVDIFALGAIVDAEKLILK